MGAAQKATEGAFDLVLRLTGMEKSQVPVAAAMVCCVAAPGSIVPCVLIHGYLCDDHRVLCVCVCVCVRARASVRMRVRIPRL